MADDIKKPNDSTDPWIVITLTRIDERQQAIKADVATTRNWVNEHDVRHRKIDGRMAVIALGIPIISGLIGWALTVLFGG